MHTTPLLIGEASRLIGVSEKTLREWDRIGKVRPERTGSGVRLFSREQCERLAEERRSASKHAVAHE